MGDVAWWQVVSQLASEIISGLRKMVTRCQKRKVRHAYRQHRVLKLPTASCEDCASAVGVPCKVEHVAADPVTPRWQDEEAVLI